MMTESNLMLHIQQAIDDIRGEVSIIVITDGPTYYNAERHYEAGSIAKLGVVLYALHLIGIGTLDEDALLRLDEDHKRGGTGVLQYFNDGFELSVVEVIRLILIESDNTATNILLEAMATELSKKRRIECVQTEINRWLHSYHGLATTGLTDRDDHRFESDVMNPSDMLKLFEAAIDNVWVEHLLKRSHFTDGLRGFSKEKSGSSSSDRAEAKVWARWRFISTRYKRGILKRIFTCTPSQVAATKEGMLSYNGHDYLHEVGRFYGRRQADVVVCTRDVDRSILVEVGRIVHDWCQSGGDEE